MTEADSEVLITRLFTRQTLIAALTLVAIVVHLLLRFATNASAVWVMLPLYSVLAIGGSTLVFELIVRVVRP